MHKTCTSIKKNKKSKTLSIYSGLGVYRLHVFVFFVFLMPVRFLWRSCFVFCFFLMPVHVWRSCVLLFVFFNACACFVKVCQEKIKKKRAFHQHFKPFRCINHCKLQYFVFIFFQKPPPHGGPLFGGEMSLHKLFGRDFSSFFCNQCLFTISLVESFEMSGRKNVWKIFRGEISLQMPFSERLVFKIFLVGIFLQMFFGRGFFFEFVWKKCLCTVCFVERFFSRLVWWIFFWDIFG